MNNFMHPSIPIANVVLWLAVVLGVLFAVTAFGCAFIIIVEPCVRRRRLARAAVAARFNRDNDTTVLLSRCLDSGYPSM